MMKKFKKLTALMMAVLSLILLLAPANNAYAASVIKVKGDIIWQGGDPTSVNMFLMVPTYVGIADFYFHGGSKPDLMPNEYVGDGKWKLHYEHIYYISNEHPFIGIDRATLDGKWYCDKWDWNNLVYQPGLYADFENWEKEYYVANFNLTSSAPSDNSITVNRSWASGAPPVNTTVNLYRYYAVSNSYQLIKSTKIYKEQNSITFSGLYGGD